MEYIYIPLINFSDYFLAVHLTLQSLVLPEAYLNLFATIIISEEQDTQEQVSSRFQSIYPRFHSKDVCSYLMIKMQ